MPDINTYIPDVRRRAGYDMQTREERERVVRVDATYRRKNSNFWMRFTKSVDTLRPMSQRSVRTRSVTRRELHYQEKYTLIKWARKRKNNNMTWSHTHSPLLYQNFEHDNMRELDSKAVHHGLNTVRSHEVRECSTKKICMCVLGHRRHGNIKGGVDL